MTLKKCRVTKKISLYKKQLIITHLPLDRFVLNFDLELGRTMGM